MRVSKVDGGESWVAFCVGGDEWLLFSWGRTGGLCFAGVRDVAALKKSAPARTPLVEFLKSQLLKGQINAARQLQNDRVIEIECSRLIGAGFAHNRFIVLEATEPNGNFFLLDESRIIMELARHAAGDENQYRTLLPGHAYCPPPPFNGTLLEHIENLQYENLRNIKGIGRPLAELIMNHWVEKSPAEWLSALKSETRFFQLTKKGCITSFSIIFEEAGNLGESAMDAAHCMIRPLLGGARNRLLAMANKAIDKTIKSRERHRDGLQKQLNRQQIAENLKISGQLLLENVSNIPPRAECVELATWDGETKLKITLDPAMSPVQNAERYFKKYRKAQSDEQRREELRKESESIDRAINELFEQKELLETIDDTEQLDAAVKDILEWLSRADEKDKKGKKQKILPPHLRFERGGAIILVGLNARGNRFVTFKQAVPADLWLHAHDIPGAHVIIKGVADEDAIVFAASLAAFYSKAKNSLRVSVDCTQRKNVRAIPGSAIAHVTYTNPRVINASPEHWRNQ